MVAFTCQREGTQAGGRISTLELGSAWLECATQLGDGLPRIELASGTTRSSQWSGSVNVSDDLRAIANAVMSAYGRHDATALGSLYRSDTKLVFPVRVESQFVPEQPRFKPPPSVRGRP